MALPVQKPSQPNKVAGKPALRRNSPWTFLFAFIYIALLIVPWMLTCLLNKGKFHLNQPKENYGYHNLTFRAQPEDITFNTNLVHATDILSYIAATSRNKVVERTRSALKSLAADEVLVKAWRDGTDNNTHVARVFASSISKDTNTGLYQQLATRMNSTCHCEISDFPNQCNDAGLNYKSESLAIEFCVDGLFQRSPWKLEQYLREDITEEFYVRLSANELMVNSGQLRPGEAYRCTGTSSLGYFELGNRFNNGRHGPLVSAPCRTLEDVYQAGFHVVPVQPHCPSRPSL